MKNLKTVNKVLSSYTYYLEPKMNKIYSQMINDNVSLEAMKKNIRNYIWSASYSWTSENGQKYFTKKKWFLETLGTLETKKSVYFLCKNSVNKAKETLVK